MTEITMEAGRELDALVATAVFGLTMEPGDDPFFMDEYGWPESVPRYSTDIASAWLVVEEMNAADWQFLLRQNWCHRWFATFLKPEHPGDSKGWDASADTPQLAICLAALGATR
jgi:hypothetical protein